MREIAVLLSAAEVIFRSVALQGLYGLRIIVFQRFTLFEHRFPALLVHHLHHGGFRIDDQLHLVGLHDDVFSFAQRKRRLVFLLILILALSHDGRGLALISRRRMFPELSVRFHVKTKHGIIQHTDLGLFSAFISQVHFIPILTHIADRRQKKEKR